MKHGKLASYYTAGCRCRKCKLTARLWRQTKKQRERNKRDCKKRYHKMIKIKREIIRQHKNVPCADCNQTLHPICMDFDHRPGTKKVDCVAKMLSVSKKKFLAEIAKCDVVCSNCHRLRSFKRKQIPYIA